MFLAFLIFSMLSTLFAFESVCQKLQVSSNIKSSKDDVIKDGVPLEKWTSKTKNPEIVTSSQMIDYLYVTLNDFKKDATYRLDYDDHFFANSTIEIESQNLQNNVKIYALEIKYRCREFGGALIDFQLEFNVPDCGKSHIFWKKVCGNPFMPRSGLSMDIEYGKYNYTMVKNGLLVNASYFDSDLDNFVFSVPSNVNTTKFYLYMEVQEDSGEKFKVKNKEEIDDIDSEKLVEEILTMIPEVDMQEPQVDADQYILSPTLSGNLSGGGLITSEAQTLLLEYNCQQSAETQVELSIPLDYFRDINLIFVKQCMMDSFQKNKSGMTFYEKLILLIVFSFLGWWGYNYYHLQLRGIDAVPFGKKAYLVWKKQHPPTQRKFPYTNDQDYESDFKIERLDQQSVKYGSI